MRVRTPNSRSRSWSLTVWTRSVAFVVAALCMAFTEGQAPPVWQGGTTDHALKTIGGLAGPHQGCGVCAGNTYTNKHAADKGKSKLATYGPGQDGWHAEEWLRGVSCDIIHGICGGGRFAQADARGLTDAIAQAAAEQDVPLLATLLEQPDVHVNSVRGAIQVTSCDGTTIAGHVPVGRDLLEAAEVLATEALDSES